MLMLWTLAFDRIGVVMSDLYFVDPALDQGDDGAERGVRLELRLFERDELKGSVYSAVPIRVAEPIWRIDLLETADSKPGSLNRAHHHPRFHGWEPGKRVFVEELSADPLTWVKKRFAEIEDVLDDARVERSTLGDDDVEGLRNAASTIVAQLEHMLAEVAAGRAAKKPDGDATFVRESWL
jgi:hypothetical protein